MIDKRARGQLRRLALYEGMSALLTFNEVRSASHRHTLTHITRIVRTELAPPPTLQDMATEFVNATLGRVEKIVMTTTR